MNDQLRDEPLRHAPAPPGELQPLLRYLTDAFALLEEWILKPGETDPDVLRIATRPHLSAAGGLIRLHHPDLDDQGPGYAETYERSASGAADLRHDVGLAATVRTEARTQWSEWTDEARRPEEIRIALRGAPGYYVQCPLDSDGKPYGAVATLEHALWGEDPDGARTIEIPVNPETDALLQMLTACIGPLRP